ncbi:hypothetical protein AVEN_91669-1 [Araneus ventricosus]|uniref:Uncharacterized protein n=1 Tax=Araneus ventricosus TaxID=182803 RepID=A0A4Y2IRS6_ARAVE|nr:hypothetical protein AVEN_91669-1 [Araneus ventricosus]
MMQLGTSNSVEETVISQIALVSPTVPSTRDQNNREVSSLICATHGRPLIWCCKKIRGVSCSKKKPSGLGKRRGPKPTSSKSPLRTDHVQKA